MSVELPKDAEGRDIPLDTTTLYAADGTPRDVSYFRYYPKCKSTEQSWHIVSMSGFIGRASRMYLNPPDSWEKLEEDLDSCCASTRYIPCAYLNKSSDDCDKCLADPTKECVVQMVKHIALRIHKLRGEGE